MQKEQFLIPFIGIKTELMAVAKGLSMKLFPNRNSRTEQPISAHFNGYDTFKAKHRPKAYWFVRREMHSKYQIVFSMR